MSESERDLSDAEKQVALLTDPGFVGLHGGILARLGGGDEGERIRGLYDDVTVRVRPDGRACGARSGKRRTGRSGR